MNIPLKLTKIPILHCTHILQLLLNNAKKSYCTSVLQVIPAVHSCISINKSSIMSSKYLLSTWIKFRVRNNDTIKVRRRNTQYPTSLKMKAVKTQCNANYIRAQCNKNPRNEKSHNNTIHEIHL